MTEKKRCGTCRFWGKEKEGTNTHRSCRRIIHDEEDYTDEELYEDEDFKELDPVTIADIRAIRREKAVTKDGSGYYAAIKCRDDFGCVLWEGKT